MPEIVFVEDLGQKFTVVATMSMHQKKKLDGVIGKKNVVAPEKGDVVPYTPLGTNMPSTVDASLSDSQHGAIQS
jgi:hypothetical protein